MLPPRPLDGWRWPPLAVQRGATFPRTPRSVADAPRLGGLGNEARNTHTNEEPMIAPTDQLRYVVRAALCWGSAHTPEEALLIALRNRPEGIGQIKEGEFTVVRSRGTVEVTDMGNITSDDPEAKQLTASEAFGYDTFAEAVLAWTYTTISDANRVLKRLAAINKDARKAHELIDEAEYLLDSLEPEDLKFGE